MGMSRFAPGIAVVVCAAVVWNGGDGRGKPVTSGVYFCRLRAGRESAERPMVLMR